MSIFVDGKRKVELGEGSVSRSSSAYVPETGRRVPTNAPRVVNQRIPVLEWSPRVFHSFSPSEELMRYDSSQDPNNNLVDRKATFEAQFPEFTKINLGSSFQSRPIDAYRLGSVSKKHFVVSMAVHGDEVDGANGTFKAMEILARHEEFSDFRDEWTIFFIPAVNPDGWFAGTRNLAEIGPNSETIDLDRNWDWYWSEYIESSDESKGPSPESSLEAQAVLDYFRGTGPFSGQGAVVFGLLLDQHASEDIGSRFQIRDKNLRGLFGSPAQFPKPNELLPDSFFSVNFDYYLWRIASAISTRRALDGVGPDYAVSFRRTRALPGMHNYFSSVGVPSCSFGEVAVLSSDGRETYQTASNFRLDYTIAAAIMSCSSLWTWEDAVLLEAQGNNVLKNAQFQEWESLDTRPVGFRLSRAMSNRNVHIPEQMESPIRHFDDSGESITLETDSDISLPTASEFVRVANAGNRRFVIISPQMSGAFKFDSDSANSTGPVGSPALVISHSQKTGTALSFADDDVVDIIGGGTSAPSTGATDTISRIEDISNTIPVESTVGSLNTARMFHACADNFLSGPSAGDQRAFVFGGFDSGSSRLTSIEIWDPDAATSTDSVDVLPIATAEALAVYYPPTNVVYVFGGSTVSDAIVDTILAYNVVTDSVSVVSTTMIVPLKNMAGAYSVINGKIYIFGGELSSGDMSSSVYSFDPDTEEFVLEQPTSVRTDGEEEKQPDALWETPIGRWFAVTLIENQDKTGPIYICGGRITDGSGALQTGIWLFNSSDLTITLPSLTDPGRLGFEIPGIRRGYTVESNRVVALKTSSVSGKSFIGSAITFFPSGAGGVFLELSENPEGDVYLRAKIDTVDDPEPGDVVTSLEPDETLSIVIASTVDDDFALLDEVDMWNDPSDAWESDGAGSASSSTIVAGSTGPLILRNKIDWENTITSVDISLTEFGVSVPITVIARGIYSGATLVDGYKIEYTAVQGSETWRLKRRNASTFQAKVRNTILDPYDFSSVDPSEVELGIEIDGGGIQIITFSILDVLIPNFSEVTVQNVVNVINDQLVGGLATVSPTGRRIIISSDTVGVGSSVQISVGSPDVNTLLGFSIPIVEFQEVTLSTLVVSADATRQVGVTPKTVVVKVEEQDPVIFNVTFDDLSIFSNVIDGSNDRIRVVGEIAIDGGVGVI